MRLLWGLLVAPSNRFQQTDPAINAPYTRAKELTQSDTEDLAEIPRAICAFKSGGSTTKIKVLLADDDTPTIFFVVSGDLLPMRVKRVYLTDTDATHVTALY